MPMLKAMNRMATSKSPRVAAMLLLPALAWSFDLSHVAAQRAEASPHSTHLRSASIHVPKISDRTTTPPLECAACREARERRTDVRADARRAETQAAPAAIQPAATSFVSHPRATPVRERRNGIGRTYRFSHGRVLNMDLTPSPQHCAPWIQLRF